MAERNSRKASTADLAAPGPDRIRNVVLVGPHQSGKTTLFEGLRARRTDQVPDRSVTLTVAPVVVEGVKVNLIDTPGYADFVGDLRAGLRAADCALFVIGANDATYGIDVPTMQLWRECDAVGMPRAVVITKLDHARADPEGVLREVRSAMTGKVLPVYVSAPDGLVGLISEGAVDDPRRSELIEAVIEESEDESLMDRYVAGERIGEKVLVADLEKAVARGGLFPVIPVCAASGVGLTELLDLCVRAFPSPPEHTAPEAFTPAGAAVSQQVECDPSGPLVAEVVHTASDPYLGRTSLVRVFSGTLLPDMSVHVSGHFSSFGAAGHEDHDEDERIGALTYSDGSDLVPAASVVAGDIAVVGRLSRAETGDTLSDPDRPLVLRPWAMPEPLLPIAVEAATRSDEDKLSAALSRLAAEDPSLRVEFAAETGQVVIWTMGEAHADVALARLRDRYGVAIEQQDLVTPLRECFTGPARGHGRNVKQSGGHGQYAVCDIEVEPLPEGSGFEFVDKVTGGAVPRQFIPSVEKGVRAQMEKGVRAGFPVVDLRVTLVDGKAHSVDSSDMAFQTAGALALKDAAAQTAIAFLEPYDEVAVTVTDDLVGAVMSDLSARRGRLLGTDQDEQGLTVVRAHVPQRGLERYAIELRAATHGAGTFTRTFAHYERAPETG